MVNCQQAVHWHEAQDSPIILLLLRIRDERDVIRAKL